MGRGSIYKPDDQTNNTMVENNQVGGNSCRCACQEDTDASENGFENSHSCCNPQVFTSILLGTLACVLVSGGVFLAFHRWDPMWLLVSGIGIVLIFIGTILHRCSNGSDARRNSAGSKSCCNRPLPPDHHNHPVVNSPSLTEQLLPLSNARSVSQLSLNMLPGYFPPVVSAYGIEQHSAVVQNINRLVQQQQQQQQQIPGSVSPGAGKSFILLSLPGDANPTNIQNLVATVYQLDANVVADNSATEVPSQASAAKPAAAPSPNVKNAEVQTCNIWPILNALSTAGVVTQDRATTSGLLLPNDSNNNGQSDNQTTREVSCGTTQTEEASTSTAEPVNLMDCSPDLAPICDSVSDNQCVNNSAVVNVSGSSSNVLVDVSEPSDNVLIDISEMPDSIIVVEAPVFSQSIGDTLEQSSDTSMHSPDTIVDIPDPTNILINVADECNVPIHSNHQNPENVHNLVPEGNDNAQTSTTTSTEGSNLQQLQTPTESSQLEVINPELSSSASNLSAIDAEIDDSELLGRSSPPPSYDDVTHESEAAAGAFGLAYGTI